MFELHHLKGNSYYIDGPTNCGLYKLNDKDVVLIDCGTKQDSLKIYEVIKEHGFNVKYIILTHAHADHCGGASLFLEKTHAKLITSKIERAFMRNDKLDIGYLYGGYPLDDFDTPLMHIEEQREIYPLSEIPSGLKSFKLKGHHYDMIGIKTDDDVYFVADTLGSKTLVDTQHILLIYDVSGYLDSLKIVEELDGNIIVPSHSKVTSSIKDLVEFNRNKIYEIMNVIINYLNEEHTAEDVSAYIFSYYNLHISNNRYMLIMATIRSYLSYLYHIDKIEHYFKDNKLYFHAK